MKTKWIVVTGGVVSGIGKGTAAASIAKLLSRQFKIVPVKCDGYLNIDPGTMNPFEHGEVFVLDDGGEVDMDFGHYERFMDINCKFDWNLTSGKIFDSVIKKERKGDYLGNTVQIIPHVTSEIKRRFLATAKAEEADVMLIEIGGTVGDIENSWFVEAVRQLKKEVGPENIMYVHLSYIPFLKSVGQQKTKPVQRDVEKLHEKGIFPDVIIGRSEHPLSKESKKKIAMFCDVEEDAVISAPDIKSIYEIPIVFEDEGLLGVIAKKFDFKPERDMANWKKLVGKIKEPAKEVSVAICGKYTALQDSYASLVEALIHAGAHNNARIKIEFVETTDIETKKVTAKEALKKFDGIIVPIGFGERGAEGKIECIKYARENGVPFLGLCYGLQLAVVEFARHVCGLKDANSTEINPKTEHPVVAILPEQVHVRDMGGTMRLGLYEAQLVKGTQVAKLYGGLACSERHRHRYEVNPEYHKILTEKGLVISGTSEHGRLVEFIELPDHPYFVATQAHPEYRSRLEKPSPLFMGFVGAMIKEK